jgi:hypothetical protein
MKQYIGGFLELELFPQPGPGYHAAALGLHNARACVSHVIAQTAMRRAWVPYYTCNALLEPFEVDGVPYQFYALDAQLELFSLPVLAEGEYLVYVNYFGLKNAYVRQLLAAYGGQLIVDDTQAYFAQGYGAGWSFNSARKSFGVPDGGYLYGPADILGTDSSYPLNTTYNATYLIDRLRGAQQKSYAGFIAYEQTLGSAPLRISEFSAALLSQVDYAAARAARRANYAYYHARLGHLNTLAVPADLMALPADTVPFCYPLLATGGEDIDRQEFFKKNLFIPTLWPDVLTRQFTAFDWEHHLTKALLPLPLDHRYGPTDLERVVQVVLELLGEEDL